MRSASQLSVSSVSTRAQRTECQGAEFSDRATASLSEPSERGGGANGRAGGMHGAQDPSSTGVAPDPHDGNNSMGQRWALHDEPIFLEQT